MPLAIAPYNTELVIRRIGAAAEVRKHLQEIGISEGRKVTVISSTGGNVILMVMEGRVCLDKHLAGQILVA